MPFEALVLADVIDVEWNFGDQRVTNGTVGDRYDFEIGFIGRVENTAVTNNGDVISNGDPATVATASYIDEADNSVILNFGQFHLEHSQTLEELGVSQRGRIGRRLWCASRRR